MADREPTSGDRTVIYDVSAIRQATGANREAIRLVVVEGSDPGRQLEITEGRIKIGRDAGNGLVLDIPSVSRTHAEIVRSANICTITDLGAANGVFVNGDRLNPVEPKRLRHGDVLQLGKARMLFLDPATERLAGHTRPQTKETESWIKRIYAIDPLAEKDL